jgi:hypothetical protein
LFLYVLGSPWESQGRGKGEGREREGRGEGREGRGEGSEGRGEREGGEGRREEEEPEHTLVIKGERREHTLNPPE